MFFSAQKNIQNQVALRCTLQPLLLDMFKKNFLFFRQWLYRGHQCQDFNTTQTSREETVKQWSARLKVVSRKDAKSAKKTAKLSTSSLRLFFAPFASLRETTFSPCDRSSCSGAGAAAQNVYSR